MPFAGGELAAVLYDLYLGRIFPQRAVNRTLSESKPFER
jgi:hypothetical protein